jgi:hypothetical protein
VRQCLVFRLPLRATPAATRDLGLYCLIQRTGTQISRQIWIIYMSVYLYGWFKFPSNKVQIISTVFKFYLWLKFFGVLFDIISFFFCENDLVEALAYASLRVWEDRGMHGLRFEMNLQKSIFDLSSVTMTAAG